ncbi:efflux RND transporter periplasmic adaptor subunit [bacterium]|nr:efflux RND transporter periplasmic adaptor subunit [bacterium]
MKRTITIISILALVALLVLSGVHQVRKSKAELPKSISELQAEQGVPVEVVTVERGTFNLARTYLGTVEGTQQSEITPMITQEVVAVPVKVGDKVSRGDVVCRLDGQTMQAQSNQAKLAYEDAEREVKRMQNLFTSGAISKQMLDKAELGRGVARENYLASAQLVDLVSPIDGVVTDILVRQGQMAMQGEPVVVVADLEKVKISFAVNHNDWQLISKSSPVSIRLNGGSGKEIPAAMSEISIAADAETRLFNVWVEAENIDGSLQPGLLVDTRVVVIQKPDVILTPRDAVVKRNDVAGVFVVNSDGKAVFTPLRTAESNTSYIVAAGGLQAGQTVVVYGQNNLNDGQSVNVVNP